MFEAKRYAEVKRQLTIDPMALDDELMRYPMVLQEATEAAADAGMVRDAAKHEYDVAEADAAYRIRSIVDDAGKSPSEARVTTLVPLDAQVRLARQTLDECNHDLGYWRGLVDALREKGGALKKIAELTMAGYLAPNAAYVNRREEINRGRTKLRPSQ
jgi:hypothetical protein